MQQTAGIGPVTARRLLQQFATPADIFSSSHARLAALCTPRIAEALLAAPPAGFHSLLQQTLAWAGQPQHHCLYPGHPAYPALLEQIADPPLILYVRGRLELLQTPAVAVVGSRQASRQGLRDAAAFAASLSHSGITVVSGLAAGIDAAAHRAALTGIGSSVAVIGTGIDRVYPASHRELNEAMAEKACIISEYPLGTAAVAANFPRRNRLIAGLSRGVLVVEAALQSGSLITARVAAEQGREVFAIPGSIHSPMAKGCHALIKQGAKLVETAADILEELAFVPGLQSCPAASNARPQPAAAAGLLAWLGYEPVSLDSLVIQSGSDVASVMAELTELELTGQIEQLAGACYRRLA